MATVSKTLQHPEGGIDHVSTRVIPHEGITAIRDEIKGAKQARHEWEKKLLGNYQKRHGVRAQKVFPWPNCSNINIPLVDSKIRQAKPHYVNAVFGPSPMCGFEPIGAEDPSKGRSVANVHDWLVRYRMKNTWEEVNILADQRMVFGMAYLKTTWDYRTERVIKSVPVDDIKGVNTDDVSDDDLRGAATLLWGLDPEDKHDAKAMDSFVEQFRNRDKVIYVSVRAVVANEPKWEYVDPRDVIVPYDSFGCIDDLPWVVHVMMRKPEYIREKAATGMYKEDAAKRVVDNFTRQSTDTGNEPSARGGDYVDTIAKQTEEEREGTQEGFASANYIELHEVHFWYDLDGDGLKERVRMVVDFATGEVLMIRPYLYDHGQWPLTKFTFELTDRRYQSPRGIPEMLHDLQHEINATHNAWLDRMTIQNAMTFKYREGSIRDPGNNRFIPGVGIGVKRMDDLEPFSFPMLDFSFDAQEKVLRAWGDDYIGSTQLGYTNTVQRSERRTAAEVESIEQDASIVTSLDVQLFQKSMTRVHYQTWRLWIQFGDKKTFVRVDGGEPVEYSREDLDGQFDLIPVGSLDNASPRQRQSRAMQNMQVARDPSFGRYFNRYEMARDYIENSPDFRDAERFLEPPGGLEQNAQQEQANEIVLMMALGVVADVNITEDHQVHMQTLQLAIQRHQESPFFPLLVAHLGLHLIAMGDQQSGEQALQSAGYAPQQSEDGQTISAIPVQQGA